MSRTPKAALIVWGAGLGVASILCAQPSGRPLPTIREGIDESRLVTLVNNTRPEATRANDRGRVPDELPMDHMLLQMKRSPEREAASERYIAELHDSASPNFHKWLTPEHLPSTSAWQRRMSTPPVAGSGRTGSR